MAGRIALLKKDIGEILSKQPQASPRYVKMRRYILLALIDDLQAINHVIPRLSSMNKNIIQKLILYWKAQGNSGNTIYLKITILRNVCKHYFISNPIPSNQELDIAYYLRNKTIELDNTPMLDSNNSIVNYLYRLQRYFGLKMLESVKIESYMFDKDRLCVAHAAAYNNKNRFIPYWCEEQKPLVSELLIDTSITKINNKICIEQDFYI